MAHFSRKYLYPFILLLEVMTALLPGQSARAGNELVVWAQRQESRVLVEAYCQSGEPVKNGLVRVTDPSGAILLTAELDEKGRLEFDYTDSHSLTIDIRQDEKHSGSVVLDKGKPQSN